MHSQARLESYETLPFILRTRNMSLFPSCDVSQSSHGDLMTQEFCDTALLITICDFKKASQMWAEVAARGCRGRRLQGPGFHF